MEEIGLDETAVLLPDDEPEIELTEVMGQVQTSPMTEAQKEQLFYSCLRGYGWKG